MERDETAEALGLAYAAFPHLTLLPQAIELWYSMFAGETREHFQTALLMAIKSSGNFFPTPALVHDTLAKVRAGTALLTPEEAYSVACDVAEFVQKSEARRIEAKDKFFLSAQPILRKLLNDSKIYDRLVKRSVKYDPRQGFFAGDPWTHKDENALRWDFITRYKRLSETENIQSGVAALSHEAKKGLPVPVGPRSSLEMRDPATGEVAKYARTTEGKLARIVETIAAPKPSMPADPASKALAIAMRVGGGR